MEDNKYYRSFDEFLQEHPEVNPDWRPFMEPVVQGAEQQVFSFILSYIFM